MSFALSISSVFPSLRRLCGVFVACTFASGARVSRGGPPLDILVSAIIFFGLCVVVTDISKTVA